MSPLNALESAAFSFLSSWSSWHYVCRAAASRRWRLRPGTPLPTGLSWNRPQQGHSTEQAVRNIGLETSTVSADPKSKKLSVPYEAILYDSQGKTWVYTNPEPLVYVRGSVTVERIDGQIARLADAGARHYRSHLGSRGTVRRRVGYGPLA